MSHDQDGHHAHMWYKPLKIFCSNRKADNHGTWYAAASTRVLINLLKCCLWVDLDLFYDKVKFGPLCFCMVGWLVVLRLNVPVNNFSVMSGRSHRFLGN